MSELGFPRDWPRLWTGREMVRVRRASRATYQPCSCCSLYVEARNRARHVRACTSRRRNHPEQWRAWREAHTKPEV